MQDAPFGDSQGELQARPASQKRFSELKKELKFPARMPKRRIGNNGRR
jgi:hypothetical protein